MVYFSIPRTASLGVLDVRVNSVPRTTFVLLLVSFFHAHPATSAELVFADSGGIFKAETSGQRVQRLVSFDPGTRLFQCFPVFDDRREVYIWNDWKGCALVVVQQGIQERVFIDCSPYHPRKLKLDSENRQLYVLSETLPGLDGSLAHGPPSSRIASYSLDDLTRFQVLIERDRQIDTFTFSSASDCLYWAEKNAIYRMQNGADYVEFVLSSPSAVDDLCTASESLLLASVRVESGPRSDWLGSSVARIVLPLDKKTAPQYESWLSFPRERVVGVAIDSLTNELYVSVRSNLESIPPNAASIKRCQVNSNDVENIVFGGTMLGAVSVGPSSNSSPQEDEGINWATMLLLSCVLILGIGYSVRRFAICGNAKKTRRRHAVKLFSPCLCLMALGSMVAWGGSMFIYVSYTFSNMATLGCAQGVVTCQYEGSQIARERRHVRKARPLGISVDVKRQAWPTMVRGGCLAAVECLGLERPKIRYNKSSQLMISIPMWCIALVLISCSLLLVLIQRRWMSAAIACSECDYCLWGNKSGLCPECGTPVPEEQRQAIAKGTVHS